MLDHLEKVAHGDAPPTRPEPHAATAREWSALDLAQYIDRTQSNDPYHPAEMSDADRSWVNGQLMSLMHPYTVLSFFDAEIRENVVWPLREKIKRLEDALAAAKLIDGAVEGTGQACASATAA